MRSQYEQTDPIVPSDYRDFQILSEVVEAPDITQRQLSGRVGIALGLTNILLRNLVQKGYVRVSKASWKRRLYTLTPDGFSHRVHLMVGYVHKVLDHYGKVRLTLRAEIEPLALNRESRVAIYGTGEFAELVYLGLREFGIEEIDVYDSGDPDGRRFLGMPVCDVTGLDSGEYDWVLVGVLDKSDGLQAGLREKGVPSDKLVVFFTNGSAGEEH